MILEAASLGFPSNSKPLASDNEEFGASLPGVDYTFVVTASKGFDVGGKPWSKRRQGTASCVVSTYATDYLPISVTPKVTPYGALRMCT